MQCHNEKITLCSRSQNCIGGKDPLESSPNSSLKLVQLDEVAQEFFQSRFDFGKSEDFPQYFWQPIMLFLLLLEDLFLFLLLK